MYHLVVDQSVQVTHLVLLETSSRTAVILSFRGSTKMVKSSLQPCGSEPFQNWAPQNTQEHIPHPPLGLRWRVGH